MLVALHGNGDTPANFYKTSLNLITTPARVVLLQGPYQSRSGYAWPWKKEEYDETGHLINGVIQELSQQYPTANKPILFGFSGGGMFAYYSALFFGSQYSYIYPISGRLTYPLTQQPLLDTGAKVLAYHGKSDNVISFSSGKSAVSTLRNKDIKVEFIEFSTGHQGIFYEMKAPISQQLDQSLLSISL